MSQLRRPETRSGRVRKGSSRRDIIEPTLKSMSRYNADWAKTGEGPIEFALSRPLGRHRGIDWPAPDFTSPGGSSFARERHFAARRGPRLRYARCPPPWLARFGRALATPDPVL